MVKAQDGSELGFKLKGTTYLGKVFTAYRQKTGTPNKSRFLLEGSVLDDLHTCSFYGMEDGDVVDVMPQQQGD